MIVVVGINLWLSGCGRRSTDAPHRTESRNPTARGRRTDLRRWWEEMTKGEPTHKIIEKHKNSINKFSVPPFPLLSNHSNKIIYKLNIKTKAENAEFTQALHERRERTLRVLMRLSRSSRWRGSNDWPQKTFVWAQFEKIENNRDHKVYVIENLWTVMVTRFKRSVGVLFMLES